MWVFGFFYKFNLLFNNIFKSILELIKPEQFKFVKSPNVKYI